MRVVVGGGRYFEDRQSAYAALDYIDENVGRIDRLAHGGCRGADKIAGDWAKLRGREVQVYEADWDTFGRRAGPVRNGRMLRTEAPDLVVTFPGGSGTANLTRLAEDMGIRIFKVERG